MGGRLYLEDYIGKKFNLLTIIDSAETPPKKAKRCLCTCECGEQVTKILSHVIQGKVKSCGCLHRNTARRQGKISNLTHGLSKHPLHGVWSSMKARCSNPNNRSYTVYGARGITVCDEWKNNFYAFYQWAVDNGYKSGLSVERKDVDKGYSPDNCELIPLERQASNKSTSRWVTINKITRTLKDWCIAYDMPYNTVYARVKRGMEPELALTKPISLAQSRKRKDGNVN